MKNIELKSQSNTDKQTREKEALAELIPLLEIMLKGIRGYLNKIIKGREVSLKGSKKKPYRHHEEDESSPRGDAVDDRFAITIAPSK